MQSNSGMQKRFGLGSTYYLVMAAGGLVGAYGLLLLALLEWIRGRKPLDEMSRAVTMVVGSLGFLTAVIAYRRANEREQDRNERIVAYSAELRKTPEKSKLAWDLAQEKLESYLDRNLSQVRWIFVLCVIVMAAGFGLVCYGAHGMMIGEGVTNAGMLTSISGVLISFLGGSFLLIYKATMTQAKEYVTMLERINAVGMSIQIIETLSETDAVLKNQSKADLAAELLKLYGSK
ncbi:MAG TPA: hypothetical protein PLN52_24420 [Opitutaceae bacterium]|nr:hypothetical protein [Opitutaceae bacterium]